LYQRFSDCSSLITKVDDFSSKNKVFADAIKDFHPSFKIKYDSTEKKFSLRPDGLFARINKYRVLATATTVLKQDEEKNVADSFAALEEAIKLLDDFMNRDWVTYQNNLSNKQIPAGVLIR
jgi:hypothetical protein